MPPPQRGAGESKFSAKGFYKKGKRPPKAQRGQRGNDSPPVPPPQRGAGESKFSARGFYKKEKRPPKTQRGQRGNDSPPVPPPKSGAGENKFFAKLSSKESGENGLTGGAWLGMIRMAPWGHKIFVRSVSDYEVWCDDVQRTGRERAR